MSADLFVATETLAFGCLHPAMSAQLAPPRLLELFHSPPPSAGNSTTIELTAISALAAATSPHISSQTESTPAPEPQKILDAFPVASAPPSSDRPSIAPSASPARFFDSLFHDHSHPHHDQHEIDEDLPGYKDAAVAPVIAAVKGGFSTAAPFAFLNYLLLLTILYVARCRDYVPIFARTSGDVIL